MGNERHGHHNVQRLALFGADARPAFAPSSRLVRQRKQRHRARTQRAEKGSPSTKTTAPQRIRTAAAARSRTRTATKKCWLRRRSSFAWFGQTPKIATHLVRLTQPRHRTPLSKSLDTRPQKRATLRIVSTRSRPSGYADRKPKKFRGRPPIRTLLDAFRRRLLSSPRVRAPNRGSANRPGGPRWAKRPSVGR
jgi:hypothetical protein